MYSTAHGQLNTRVHQTRVRHVRAIVTYAVYTLLPGLVCAAVRGWCCGYWACELVHRRSVVKRNCNVAKTASLCIQVVFIHMRHCACVFRTRYARGTRRGHAKDTCACVKLPVSDTVHVHVHVYICHIQCTCTL